jgi:hypothetical protein
VPFRFNGTIDKLTFKLGPVQLTNEEHQIIQSQSQRLTEKGHSESIATYGRTPRQLESGRAGAISRSTE